LSSGSNCLSSNLHSCFRSLLFICLISHLVKILVVQGFHRSLQGKEAEQEYLLSCATSEFEQYIQEESSHKLTSMGGHPLCFREDKELIVQYVY
jgi:hypothetical protein